MKTKIIIISLILVGVYSCKKYEKYDNHEIIENTFEGTVSIDNDSDPDGNFTGENNSGVFSFAWTNTAGKAKVKLTLNGPSTGTVKLTLNDAKGKVVFSKSLSGANDDTSFEEYSETGKTGNWKVSLVFSDFNGTGSFEIDPTQ